MDADVRDVLHVDGGDAVVGTPGTNVSGGPSAGMAEYEAGATGPSVSVSAPVSTSDEAVPGTPERLHTSGPPAAHTPPRSSVRVTDEMTWFVSNVLPELEARSTDSRLPRPSSPPGRPVRRGGPPGLRARARLSPRLPVRFPRVVPPPSTRISRPCSRASRPNPPLAAERSRARASRWNTSRRRSNPWVASSRGPAARGDLRRDAVRDPESGATGPRRRARPTTRRRLARPRRVTRRRRRRRSRRHGPRGSPSVANPPKTIDASRRSRRDSNTRATHRTRNVRVRCMEAPANALFYRCGHLCCRASAKLDDNSSRVPLCRDCVRVVVRRSSR